MSLGKQEWRVGVHAVCKDKETGAVQDRFERIHISFGNLFFGNQKKAHLSKLAPEAITKTLSSNNQVLLHFEHESSLCEIQFEEEEEAEKFIGAVQLIRNRRKFSSSAPGGPASSSTSSLQIPQSRKAASSPRRKHRADDELGSLSGNLLTSSHVPSERSVRPMPMSSETTFKMQSHAEEKEKFQGKLISDAHTPPAAGASAASNEIDESEAKRRRLDKVCGTRSDTPEKVPRSYGSYGSQGPVRERPRPNTVVFSSRKPSVAPQSSAQYGSYRSAYLTGGLQNLGNTCYLNAVIQALCSLREFIRDLRKMPEDIPQVADRMLFKNSLEIFGQMGAVGAAAGPLSPAKLRELIAQASPMFAGNQQQDAHEFTLDYINQLHDELLSARKDWLEAQSLADSEELGMLATQSHLDSEVQKTLLCCGCQKTRDVFERFRDFSLDFPAAAQKSGVNGVGSSERCELRSMLENYFDHELLEVKCPFEGCASVAANMQKYLSSAPRVLVLHLKRFVPNIEKQMYEKHHQHVEIPLSIDLRAYLRKAYTGSSNNEAWRSSLPARPLAAEVAAPAAIWEVHLEDRGWTPFADDEAGVLETKYTSSPSGTCELQARNQRYMVDFSNLKQVNQETGRSRQIRRRLLESMGDHVGGGPFYDLRSVVAHEGPSPNSGHYVCYARGDTGVWKCYDDSYVTEVQDPRSQLGRRAYILFYVMQMAQER